MNKYISFILNLLLLLMGALDIIEGQILSGLVFITISVKGVEKISTTYKNLKR